MATTNSERFIATIAFAAPRSLVATVAIVLATATAARAQTDYFWNATGDISAGGTGTWDTVTPMWSDSAAGPLDYIWLNNGDERANFGDTAGTVTLGENISAYGINFNTTGYTIAGGGNVLTLTGAGGPINVNTGAAGLATISAQVDGNVGLTVVGRNAPNGGNLVAGTLLLTAANTYTGGTTVTGATLVGNPQAAGSPFSSGAITLNGAVLDLKAANANATSATTVGNLTIGGATASTVGASQLIVDDQANSPSVTFAPGNLVRGGSGSALVITPNTGSLGNKEVITLANGNSLLTNGILPPWVVTTASGSDLTANFVTYGSGAAALGDYNHDGTVNAADYVLWRKSNINGATGYSDWRTNFGATGSGNGVTVANYTSTNLATSTSTSVVDQSTAPTITGNVAAYALKTNQAIDLGGNTLTLGSGSGQSGLILNGGGSITNGNITFGPTEATVFSEGDTTLGSSGNTITSNGLTITGVGATTTTINGNIVDGTVPTRLVFTGPTANSGLVLNGNNTYTGGTILGVNNSAGGTATAIGVGSDTAFGTGKVTNILLPGTSSPIMQALGGDRTLANAFDLNGGLTFQGSNSFTFTGPFNIIQPQDGGSRTLQNAVTASGKSVTYGASPGSSTITLGNPVANGGDGVGKTLIFSSNLSGNTTTIINDVFQDPAAGGGTASGSVQYGSTGSGSGNTALFVINSQSTYSGTTILQGNNQTTIQFNSDTVGSYPSISSGPFGSSTLLFNNTSNNTLQPTGGGTRILANPITLNFGYTFNNASGDDTSLMLTGPITLLDAGRTLSNSMSSTATLTLGDPNAPSTLTLNGAGGSATIRTNGSSTTVINDVIQDPAGGPAPVRLIINGPGTTTLNALSTYSSGTELNGANQIFNIMVDSNALPGGSFTAGPFGTGDINFNNGSNQHLRPRGGDRTISNAILMTTGFAMDNAPGETYNLTYAGPISMTNAGKFISNGFSSGGPTGTMILGDASAPSTITLSTGVNANLSLVGVMGPIVVNDVIQDATGIAGNISVNPQTDNFPVTFNAANTFTGNANLGGGSAATGQIRLGLSTDGDFGAINSGPLGVGTIVANCTNATTPPLTPYNADRTLSNAVNINGNLGAANAPTENFNLNLTGPISVVAATSRSIFNNMTGTLTLGKSTVVDSTQPVTLSGTGTVTLTFAGGDSSATVVNDVIQNGGGGLIPGLVAVSGSIVRFNNDNTYGPSSPGTTTNTTVSGTGTLLVNNTTGSGTGTGNVSVTGGTLGGTGTISQSVTATGGAIAPGDPAVNNGAGTLNIGGNLAFSGTGGLTVELGGTTAGTDYDQLLVAGTADVSSAGGGTLTVSLINGFSPSVDTDFTVLTATGGLTTNAGAGYGNFAYPDFTHWTTNYTADSVVVHYSAAGGAGAGSNLGGNAAVPEPGALILGILAVAALLTSRGGVCRRQRV